MADALALRLAFGSAHPPNAPLDGVVSSVRTAGRRRSLTISAEPGGQLVPRRDIACLAAARRTGGGLLLNLMPCVFPVLAMKAMALARLSGADRRTIRVEAGSYTLASSSPLPRLAPPCSPCAAPGRRWVGLPVPIAGLRDGRGLGAVRHRAEHVRRVCRRRAAGRAGQSLAARRGHIGSFFTGLLAVVVATPCTAAFMGAAVAGALAAPAGRDAGLRRPWGWAWPCPTPLIACCPGLAQCCRAPGGGWRRCARRWRSRCMARRPGWSGSSASRPARRAFSTARPGLSASGLPPGRSGGAQSGRAPGATWLRRRHRRGLRGALLTVQTGPRPKRASRSARPGSRAAGRGAAGLRQHDGGLVPVLPAERAACAVPTRRPARVRAGARGLPQG